MTARVPDDVPIVAIVFLHVVDQKMLREIGVIESEHTGSPQNCWPRDIHNLPRFDWQPLRSAGDGIGLLHYIEGDFADPYAMAPHQARLPMKDGVAVALFGDALFAPSLCDGADGVCYRVGWRGHWASPGSMTADLPRSVYPTRGQVKCSTKIIGSL